MSVKILLLGDSGTGKTSLVLRYMYGPDAEEAQAARCSVYDPDVLVKELVVDGKTVKVSGLSIGGRAVICASFRWFHHSSK